MNELKVICKGGRFAVVEMADGGIYHTREAYELLVNGESRETCMLIKGNFTV